MQDKLADEGTASEEKEERINTRHHRYRTIWTRERRHRTMGLPQSGLTGKERKTIIATVVEIMTEAML